MSEPRSLDGCGPSGSSPWADVAAPEYTLVDGTGGIAVVFLGRREVAGIQPGTLLMVEGVAGAHRGKLAMLNADYTILGS